MRIAVLAALLAFSASCKKAEAPAPVKSEAPASLPMPVRTAEETHLREEMKKLDALGDAELRLAEKNRRTMIAPALAGFKPEPVARKIRLNLVLEKKKLRVGENARFRLELTNVGRDPIDYIEYESSVFRGGGLLHSIKTIRFVLTDKASLSHDLEPSLSGRPAPLTPRDGPPSLEEQAESSASTTFKVRILPGETLRSLGDGDSATEPFRTMLIRDEFKIPGHYRIQVKLDDRPRPLSATYIEMALHYKSMEEIQKDHAKQVADALGPVASNVVAIEVVR